MWLVTFYNLTPEERAAIARLGAILAGIVLRAQVRVALGVGGRPTLVRLLLLTTARVWAGII